MCHFSKLTRSQKFLANPILLCASVRLCVLFTYIYKECCSIYPDNVDAFEIVFVPPGNAPGIPVTIANLFFRLSTNFLKNQKFSFLLEKIFMQVGLEGRLLTLPIS